MSEQLQDPFDGNEQIEEAIKTFFENSTEENLDGVVQAIRKRMHEDGQFYFPVIVDEQDNRKFSFRTVQTSDGEKWPAAFTSKAEYEKGVPSNILANFIDSTLKSGLEINVPGFLINPWGLGFKLSRKLIKRIFKEDGGKEYSVPEEPLTEKLLEDGSYLKRAVGICKRNRTQLNIIKLIRILRDSNVWVPCNVIMSDRDYNDFKQVIKEPQSKAKGKHRTSAPKTFTNSDDLCMIPDILKYGEDYFYPVFATAEEMGEYGKNFSKVQKPFLEAVTQAQHNKQKVAGIVVNAFTEPVVIPAELFDIIVKMESAIQ